MLDGFADDGAQTRIIAGRGTPTLVRSTQARAVGVTLRAAKAGLAVVIDVDPSALPIPRARTD